MTLTIKYLTIQAILLIQQVDLEDHLVRAVRIGLAGLGEVYQDDILKDDSP